MSNKIVDTVDHVRNLIEVIETSQPQPAFLFIDIEGVDLSRNGSIAIIQLLVPPQQEVYLVDVHILKAEAFETSSTSGLNLRTILESEKFPKVFFDIRNDSDALYSHFHINVSGVVDLQLLEFATRPVRGRFVKGLSTCISETNMLSWAERRDWYEGKEAGKKLFAPERGGRYEVFLERPIPLTIVNYCTQDVLYMPKLLLRYSRNLNTSLASQVQSETFNRILLSQSLDFCGKGKHMALGPTFVSKSSVSQSPLPFPMDLVCSTNLVEHCTFVESSTVDASHKENVAPSVAEPAKLAVPAKEHVPSTSDPLDSVVHFWRGAPSDENSTEDYYEDCNPGSQTRSKFGDDSDKDFTACSADDCGYCGHCMY